MRRIVIVDNEKLKDMEVKQRIVKACPVNRSGKECMKIEADGRLTADENLVNEGCKICVRIAPYALKMIRLPDELEQEPIHRYGQNQFLLYSLPTPVFGKVVGIIGRNGIGKSTAIKILAGELKPNFGDWVREKETNYDDLIKYFKGTEAQQYFEKLKKGEIKVSYKPQQVELIPKAFKGKVADLLKKADEKGKLAEYAKELGIENILDHDIKNISGGELQRVAIAACLLKKANVYLLDEPTSYLDIKQRLNISKFIRSLADDKTAIVVIEHDLIILDYIADAVNIMYGKEKCFGIVSLPKAAKTGVNVYLGGYMREENMRFRDYPIKFERVAKTPGKKEETIVDWKGIVKRLDGFKLEANYGLIARKDVIGVLGENGIGKTTFVKILADVIRPDSGELNGKVKVSYKPQYLIPGHETVKELLKDAFYKYKIQLIDPLQLEDLMDHKLNELSGGELQRAAIVYCLSQDADLYLLDEPSAYLDVEQRLIVSKIIKELMEDKGKTALVVDHDLLFLDHLSKKLLVFEGEPAESGKCSGPFAMEDGMNLFLKDLAITFRRDEESGRPRANKLGSVLDRKQKEENRFYYT